MSQTSATDAKPLRRERAILHIDGGPVGGTLALFWRKLVWKRSRWHWLWPFYVGPAELEIDLSMAEAETGLEKPYVDGPSYPKTIELHTITGTYHFSVKDVDSWLQDIDRARPGLSWQAER